MERFPPNPLNFSECENREKFSSVPSVGFEPPTSAWFWIWSQALCQLSHGDKIQISRVLCYLNFEYTSQLVSFSRLFAGVRYPGWNPVWIRIYVLFNSLSSDLSAKRWISHLSSETRVQKTRKKARQAPLIDQRTLDTRCTYCTYLPRNCQFPFSIIYYY